jgi:hypothetical protein
MLVFSPHIADPKQRKQTEEKYMARCIEGLMAEVTDLS